MTDPLQKINVRLPASVYDTLADAAKVMGVSAGKLAATLIEANLETYTRTPVFQDALVAHVEGVKRLSRAANVSETVSAEATIAVAEGTLPDHPAAPDDAAGDDGDDTHANDPMASLLS